MNEHKYYELACKLRSEIQSGRYGRDGRLPSENELTAKTGYSRQTVRQAMSVLENEGLTVRVQGSGTYVRGDKPQRPLTRNIAVVTTYIGEYIFPAILHGIDGVLSENGYSSMLFATHNRVDDERRILTELLEKPIDGIIIEGTKTALPNPNIDLYRRLEALSVPVIFINGFYPEMKEHVCVVADDREGGKTACASLIRKGHKKIGGIFKSDDIQGHRRYAGFVEALIESGLEVVDDNIMWYSTENRDALIETGAAGILKSCTACVCYNDEVALRVISALEKSGRSVPTDVELTSFDNSTFAQLSAVKFTSLSNPKESLGRLAAEKMLNILKGQKETSAVLPWSNEN